MRNTNNMKKTSNNSEPVGKTETVKQINLTEDEYDLLSHIILLNSTGYLCNSIDAKDKTDKRIYATRHKLLSNIFEREFNVKKEVRE